MEENKKPENIYAFASVCESYIQEGMTLRDYFAAKAMQSLIQDSGLRNLFAQKADLKGSQWQEVLSENAFILSDAMLKQREL